METGSYLELALTLYGWQVSNRIAELLVASGLIYIPLLWLVMRNWSQPIRSQEAKAAAPVSMRRMEQDMLIAFVCDHPVLHSSLFGQNISHHPHQPNHRKGNLGRRPERALRGRRHTE